jgi:UDP-glucose 4-epimerase
MTRFMMSLPQAVELVLFAFDNCMQGDMFVQKAPAATIEDLAWVLRDIFNGTNDIKIIGTRHGEKLYETLLAREEAVKAEDMGNYYRVPADNRDLNYGKYFDDGDKRIGAVQEYNSHNTQRLDRSGLKSILLNLDYVQMALKGVEDGGV